MQTSTPTAGILFLGLGVTWRVVKVQHLVYSETQGKQTSLWRWFMKHRLNQVNIQSDRFWLKGKEATPTGLTNLSLGQLYMVSCRPLRV